MKALFFAPFANIWEHTFPEALVAQGLQEKGIDITTVRCDGVFEDFCVAMSASGLTASDSLQKRQQVCRACAKRQRFTDKEFGFAPVQLSRYISDDIKFHAQEFAATATADNWPTLALHGVPIGKYAAYEFLLNYKILGTDIPEALFDIYRRQLRNCVVTQLAAEVLLRQESPDRVITYNRLYGVNHAFLAVAEQLGIPTYSLQGGSHVVHRGETMTMFRDSETQFQILDSPTLAEYLDSPISTNDVALVSTHFRGLMEASSAFAYSSAFEASDPDELRARMGIASESPVLLIPMSSEDELNAAELAELLPDRSSRPNLFEDQFSWIRYLFDVALDRPEYTFILRLHPRMYPNKRENVVAPILQHVMKLIDDAPPNVVVNYPTDNISLYDLLQIVDVCLGYRSTVGAEMAAYGIPVVSPENRDFFTYPRQLHAVGGTKPEFVAKIDEAVRSGWSLEHMRRAYRWFAYLFTRIAVDFSETVNAKPIAIRPKKPGLRLWLWRKFVFFVIQFGPLVRERLAMRNRATSQLSKDVIFDTFVRAESSLAMSTAWPTSHGTVALESQALEEVLRDLLDNQWRTIASNHSLAGRIRRYLNER